MSRCLSPTCSAPQRDEAGWWAGLAILLLSVLFIVYGRVLSLPFFFDDLVHIPFIDSHRMAEIWQTSGGLAYYRPLSFSVWKLLVWVLGRHDPVAQHALNLGLHGLSALFMAWLAGDLWSSHRWFRRLAAGTLFLIYPFSYQAVPWVGSMSHLLVTALILGSLVSYRRFRCGHGPAWAALSLFTSALAPFAHETGVLVGPFVALIEITDRRMPYQGRRAVGWGLIWSLPALAWFPIWWVAPKSGSAGLIVPSIERLLQNGVYFTQGIAYPFSWIGGWLRQQWAVNDLLAAALVSICPLILIAIAQTVRLPGRRSILPWAWCGLAILPAALTLSFDYVINGPRLLMVASVGAAWLWTDVLVLLLPRNAAQSAAVARWGLATSLLFLLAGQNAAFVVERVGLHQQLGAVIEQVVALATRTNQSDRPATVINFPSWLAPWNSRYALGHEGVLVWPDYAQPSALIKVHTGRDGDLDFARWDAVRPEIPYHYGVAGAVPNWATLIARGSSLFLTRYIDQQLKVVPVGTLSESSERAGTTGEFLAPDGRVVATLIEASAEVQGDGRLLVDLLWRANSVPAGVTVFVHLLDDQGDLVEQADGDPFGGLLPLSQWPADLTARDMRLVGQSPVATVRVGLYDRVTGHRMVVVGSDGQEWPDQAISFAIIRH